MNDRTPHPALTPTEMSGLALPNRLVVAPMTRVSATPEGAPTTEMAEYYAAFAHGGFGMIVTEGTYTDDRYSQGYVNQPGAVTETHLAGWARVTDAVHAAGGRIAMQLMHAGALSQGNRHHSDTVAPSPVQPRGTMMPEYGGSGAWSTPLEMSRADIEEAVRGFRDAARSAQSTGFDGVEVHAANGYLLDQFLTDYTNHRSDEYGGAVSHRARLTCEVITEIKKAVPDDFIVGVRLSQTKVNDFHHRWTAADAEVVFDAVAAAGADYLHIASEGRDWIDSARLDNGETITGIARRVSGLPVLANGGMHNPQQAADVLDGGHADLLSLGRGALADPELPRKLAAGEAPIAFDHGMINPMATLENTRRWTQAAAG
ncbi:MAG: NADH:flavin oxidoreductase [Nocardiopsaceae bacterium]|nr:NADH:flavin oxidoreductase [Nocardiopsaceae bacterium]